MLMRQPKALAGVVTVAASTELPPEDYLRMHRRQAESDKVRSTPSQGQIICSKLWQPVLPMYFANKTATVCKHGSMVYCQVSSLP